MCATVYVGCVCRPKDSLQDLVLAFTTFVSGMEPMCYCSGKEFNSYYPIFSYFLGIQDNHSTFSCGIVMDCHRLEHNLVVELHTRLPLRFRETVDQGGQGL